MVLSLESIYMVDIYTIYDVDINGKNDIRSADRVLVDLRDLYSLNLQET